MLAERMRRIPGVQAVGRTTIGVATDNNNNTGVMVPGNPEPVNIGIYTVDEGYLAAMGMQMVAGRWFDERRPMDDMTLPYPPEPGGGAGAGARGVNIVINELAARRLGFRNPADAVGRTFRAGSGRQRDRARPGHRHRRRPRRALPLGQAAARSDHVPERQSAATPMIVLRFNGNPAEVRAGVERVWKSVTTEVPFTAEFSDDIIAELYEAEDARAKTFAAFALLAIVVACLGLFGLAAFTAERRTKEIGIRKVLGARTRDIVRLLAWQFSKPMHHRQSDRLAGRLVADARLAQHVRRADRPRPDAVPARRPARSGRSRSAPSPATRSRSRAPIRSTRCATNEGMDACGVII